MRCCVPGCKNDSRHTTKSREITFHAFPSEPEQCKEWISAIKYSGWSPREKSAVCSEHFHPHDVYATRNGTLQLRPGAVPFVTQKCPISFECDKMLEVCRMCLATGQRLFSITAYNLHDVFDRVMGMSATLDARIPNMVCAECSQRLVNADWFRTRSLQAQQIIMDILNTQGGLTFEAINSIDRSTYCLTSPLQSKVNTPDQYDYEIEYQLIKEEEDNILFDDLQEVKSEPSLDEGTSIDKNDGLLAEKNEQLFTDKNKESFIDKNKQIFMKNSDASMANTSELYLGIIDEFSPQNGDGSFVASDIDGDFVADREFDSDDSLPLVVTKKKKKKDKETKKERVTPTTKKVRKKRKTQPSEPKIDRRRKPFLNEDLNETLFTITNLTFEEQIAEIQKRQESDNYKHSVFKCTECYKGFLDQGAYNGHMMRHTKECGEHQCEICKTHFKHPHALRKHITAHHTQRFSCNQCSYVTTHRQTARLHERWHKGTKYKCPHCPEEFIKFTTYMGHVRIKHPSDFVCVLCGYSFVSEKGIELHKKLKHRQEQTVPEDGPFCEPCGIRFASQQAYRQHLSVSAKHSTPENRQSNKANKGRRTRVVRDKSKTEDSAEDGDDRQYPGQLGRAEGPIPCEQCGVQLEDSRAYHNHFRRAHPDKNRTKYPAMKTPCMCELCGRMFQSYALLKDHSWVHTGERPFSCAECGKSFRMKQRLVSHRRVHAAQRASYACDLCGKCFSTHSNRQRHMFIHTGLKPFKCEMCGKSFKHASEKRSHVVYVHLKKPWPKRSRGKRPSGARQPSTAYTRQESMAETGEQADDIEMQPVWASCDPKITDIHTIDVMDGKPVYYNLKI